MSTTICLSVDAIGNTGAGGHLWVYLNWALGLRTQGCDVVWMETVDPRTSKEQLQVMVAALRGQLAPYGFAESLALCSGNGEEVEAAHNCLNLDVAAQSDLLLNLNYELPSTVVARFRRSALLDIDPGLCQLWMHAGQIRVARHQLYFTIGETVAPRNGMIPDLGISWIYTPPCVALNSWPPTPCPHDAPFTTVAHWYKGWVEAADESYQNSKRTGFLPFLDLPLHTKQRLELALNLEDDDEEASMLRKRGWYVRRAASAVATTGEYQRYIQQSRGEFSCAKPSCIRLQNAWISDRTLCYLASGKPAVVQHTGASRFLPEAEGLFRFQDLNQAVQFLDAAASDYDRHSRAARALAAEVFDASKVARSVLERAVA